MPAIRSVRNQYRGINAHLHSLWQAGGGWQGFHTLHIGDLGKALTAHLLPMNYVAEIEQSLQIRRLDDVTITPKSDITIYDLDPMRSIQPHSASGTNVGVRIMPALEVLADPPSEKPFRALAIYEFTPGKTIQGEPVVWIELLSPSNKGDSDDAKTYRAKRIAIVESGIVFVEIDYLHESRSALYSIAPYPPHPGSPDQPASHPYRIAVIDPRPDLDKASAYLSEFDVDMPIPTVTIPLSGNEMLSFDFEVPYRKTFEEMLYGLRLIDYRELPVNFERYSQDDQARIARRMLAVLEAHEKGLNLEGEPLPVEHITLETALQKLESQLARLVED